MLKALLIHLLTLGAVAGVAMLVPIGFVWMLFFPMDADASAFIRIFGSALIPFGMALCSIVIWQERSHPWVAFFITAVVIIVMVKLGVYDTRIR